MITKKLVIILSIVFALTFVVSALVSEQIINAAECGAPGTCFGMRQKPPGGCGCYTNAEGCGSGCGSPPTNPPASCSFAKPLPAGLQAPLSGSVNNPKPITLKWVNGNMGNGCPSVNYNRVYYKIKNGTCVNNPALYAGTNYFAATNQYTLNTELVWGQTYCWFVESNNQASVTTASAAYSLVAEFTVTKPPTYNGGGFSGVDVCTLQTSGRAGGNGVTNPIDWTFSFNNPEPTNKPVWYIVLALPTTGAYAVNADTFDWTTAYNYALNAGTFVYGMLYSPSTNTWSYHTLQRTPLQWNAATGNSLNTADGHATLVDINSNTSHSETGSTLSSKWRIQFNNTFPSGKYNIYGMVLMNNPNNGNPSAAVVSNDATITNPYMVRKTGSWSVDVIAPSVNISGPTLNADGTFNMTWVISDNIAINDLRSFIFSDSEGATLQDTTIGTTIPTSTVELNYPTPSNAGVTFKNQGVHNYKDLNPELGSEYKFKLVAKDTGCNFGEVTVKKDPFTPWIMGTNGDISGRGGIDKTKIPVISNFTNPFTSITSTSFFSNYSSFSGTTTNAKGTTSRFSYVANSYLDSAIISPHSTDALWYDYLQDLVKKNGKTNVVSNTGNKTISSSFSASLGATVNTKIGVEYVGDVNVTSATVCDVRAIVFVTGNLNINPDITLGSVAPTSPITNQLYNGCIFIVKGNVNIAAGTSKTNLDKTASTLANYDIVNSLIITDGVLNIPNDPKGTGKKNDGIYINGGVIAKKTVVNGATTLKRDINQEGNNLQPATLVNLDPRYKLMFGDDFASRDYNIREYGL